MRHITLHAPLLSILITTTFKNIIQYFTIEDNVCCGFVIYSFDYVEVCSFYSCFLESFDHKWMKLEPIIQSEVSQKEKHQYSILTHIYGI